ncbi:hypothetical protein G6F65_016901 [Rhizopus arrhizus]|nr:hypothetical protein G6F65_016901 [Rhizopus arrhizus]
MLRAGAFDALGKCLHLQRGQHRHRDVDAQAILLERQDLPLDVGRGQSRQRASLGLRALGAAQQQEAAVCRQADVFRQDGVDRIEVAQIAVRQDAAFTGRHGASGGRIDQARTDPVRPRLDRRHDGIAVVIELRAQFRHAVHVDAQRARHAQQLRQFRIKGVQRQVARLPLVAAGVQDAASRRQAE